MIHAHNYNTSAIQKAHVTIHTNRTFPHRHVGSVCSALDCRSAQLSLVAMTPLEVVDSFERHMSVEIRLGLCTVDESLEKTMPALTNRLKLLKPSMEQVTAVCEYLTMPTCTFSPEQKHEIGCVVSATMVDPANALKTSHVRTQQHLFIHFYMPAWLWACIESDDTKDNKFRQTGHWMCKALGCRNPDAKTKRCSLQFQKPQHKSQYTHQLRINIRRFVYLFNCDAFDRPVVL